MLLKKKLNKRRKRLTNPRSSAGKSVERKCLVHGDALSSSGLIRFVLDPDDHLIADLAGKAPGRGAWVTSTREAVATALEKKLFTRAFKRPAKFADGQIAGGDEKAAQVFIAGIEEGLEKRALAALGMARRSGDLVLGFDQVKGALKDAKAGVVISAADAAEDGVTKLARLAAGQKAAGQKIVRAFSVSAQSAALGRENAIHAALTAGGVAERFLIALARLGGFRDVWFELDQFAPKRRKNSETSDKRGS